MTDAFKRAEAHVRQRTWRADWRWEPIGHHDGKYSWYAWIWGARYQLVEAEATKP